MSPRRASLAAALVVGGLLLMHGLATHGTAASPSAHAHHAMALAAYDVPVAAPVAPGHGSHVMASCVSVLGLALVLLLGAALPIGSRPRSEVAGSLRVVAARARAPDPPDLTLLSVCRC